MNPKLARVVLIDRYDLCLACDIPYRVWKGDCPRCDAKPVPVEVVARGNVRVVIIPGGLSEKPK